MSFQIKTFADYHEIFALKNEGIKALELGCFFTKGFPNARYYALIYTGKKPKFSEVIAKVNRRIAVGKSFLGEWEQTRESVRREVKQNAFFNSKDTVIR